VPGDNDSSLVPAGAVVFVNIPNGGYAVYRDKPQSIGDMA